MTLAFDPRAAAAAIAATAANQTQAVKGGGDYTPPDAGPGLARLVGYVEKGIHTRKIPGKPDQDEDGVKLIFELVSPRHAPKVLEDGTKIPHRISIDIGLSLNEKANFFKLFSVMNYKGTATHCSQLLGEAYICEVLHKASKSDPNKKYATLKGDSGFTLRPPRISDPLTGEVKNLDNIPEAVSPLRLFVWNAPPELLKPMWDSLFIDGEYEPGRTKNVLQEEIKQAKNFINSPIHQALQTGGVALNLGAQATTPSTPAASASTASADPLAGF